MRFSDLYQLLAETQNTPYVLESSRKNKKVLVCPSLVGRVMGTTISGGRGEVLGWINETAIRKGKVDPVFNNFGGEERFWFAPEGGQFGLCMGKHISGWQYYDVQKAFTSQPFKVLKSEKESIVMHSKMRLTNAKGTNFVMDVKRTVRILDACPYTLEDGDKTDFVGFETDNVVRNADSHPIKPARGALGMFCITQFLTHPRTIAMVPFQSAAIKRLGPAIRRDYFKDFCLNGRFPRSRWKTSKNVALFKVDGKVRGKFGVGRRHAIPRLGSVNLHTNEVVIVDCDFYPELEYVASYWRWLKNPYDGDAVSISFEGPDEDGRPGKSYELETLSPALFLQPGQSFPHRNRIYHIFGTSSVVDKICRKYFNVTRDTLREFDHDSK